MLKILFLGVASMLLPCFLPAQAIGTGFDHFIVGASGDSARVVYPAIVPLESKGAALAWNVSLYGMGGSDGRMPFWAVTNRRGLFPQSLGLSASGSRDGGRFTGGGLVTGGADVSYMTRSGIVMDGGLSLAGYGAPGDWNGMVDRMYFGLGWKKLHLDIGMRDREYDFAGLSLTGGDVAYSGNARNLPGYNLHTDYIWLPFRKKVVAFKANFADYGMWDRRFVEHTLVHNESLFIKVRPFRRLDISLGLEMWSQWAGYSPQYGEQPDGFTDYLRVLVGASGGDDALKGDQDNVLGNHLGRELIRLDWHADRFTVTFQHDIPFEDKSGMRFQNFPDGVNTLALSFKDEDRWVSDVLYEFVYTRDQSGPLHDRPATEDEMEANGGVGYTILGGEDNYFNNGVYRSGWTYHGMTVGLPLAYPMYEGDDGIVMGVASNSLVAHHFGIRGRAAHKIPYRFLFTWSRHYGRTRYFDQDQAWRFEGHPQQFSIALEGEVPGGIMCRAGSDAAMLSLGIGLYADFGKVFPDSFGVTVRLSCGGVSRFGK